MSDAPTSVPAPVPSGSKGPDPLIGRVINDRYRIVSLIARGGMGKVYRAEQAPLGREVALKVLTPNYQGDNDPEFHKRFFLEASICAKLTHPNTVTIFDYGRTDDDVYYIAMELLEGRTLHRTLRDEGSIPPDRALHIARQVCRSLREAHSLGVIHRDLKPANIFLVRHGDENDFAKVLDFGLVKDLGDTGEDLTQTGLFMGSPKYMSPEQIRGETVDGRCDVYALGVILYEMLTGKVPFDRPNSVNILMAHVHESVPSMTDINPDLEIPQGLEAVVMKSMAKKPEDRYDSMDQFLVALKDATATTGLSQSRSGETLTSGEFGQMTGAYPVDISGTPHSGNQPLTPSGGNLLTASHAGTPSGSWETSLEPAAGESPSGGKSKWIALAMILLAVGAGGALAIMAPSAQPTTTTEATPEGEGEGEGESEGGEDPAEEGTTAAAEEQGDEESASNEAAEGASESREDAEEELQTVLVQLRSEPAGATVVVGDSTYGPTPADVEWAGAEAELGREVTFQFQLDGHRDYTVTRHITGDSLLVEAQMEEIQRRARPRRTIRRPVVQMRRERSSSPNIRLKGYKAEPY